MLCQVLYRSLLRAVPFRKLPEEFSMKPISFRAYNFLSNSLSTADLTAVEKIEEKNVKK